MSIWQKNLDKNKFQDFNINNTKTDVVIVGGGIAGILTAYELSARGARCIILEQNEAYSGVTKNTTAKITSQHNLIYSKLINTKGVEGACQYFKANEKALNKYKKLCENIDCDFEIKHSYVYTTSNRRKIEDEINALDKIGADAEFCENINLPVGSIGAVCLKNQAQFNPLKFLKFISKDLNIYENIKVLNIENKKVITDKGIIICEKTVVATHFPMLNRYGMYFMKMYQDRSYVAALEGADNVNGMYIDEDPHGYSFRNYNDILLLGTGSHRTGKKGCGYEKLENNYKLLYPSAVIKEKWATQDCMTLDDIPYIGLYSKHTPNIYVATGFNKWGMTSAMVSCDILCDMLSDKKSEYENLFNPARFTFNKQFFINAGQAVSGLAGISKKRCSHMGCALSYNSHEHTWDCACHGSRFDSAGQVINNPAKKNINIK